jgi:hypothetical protein
MLRWQQAEKRRHALNGYPMPGAPFTALCGATVTPQTKDFLELGGTWFDPTCGDCHNAWLDRTGATGALRWGEKAAAR